MSSHQNRTFLGNKIFLLRNDVQPIFKIMFILTLLQVKFPRAELFQRPIEPLDMIHMHSFHAVHLKR